MRWMFVAFVLAASAAASADAPRCPPTIVPPGTTNDAQTWRDSLGVAALAQANVAVAPIDRVAQLDVAIAALDRQIAQPVAIYQDALARAPTAERVLAAFGLGMTYANAAVRARAAIPSIGDDLDNPAAYDTFVTLHAAIEPLIAPDLARAHDAFAQAACIADDNPDVLADPVVAWSAASARALQASLEQ